MRDERKGIRGATLGGKSADGMGNLFAADGPDGAAVYAWLCRSALRRRARPHFAFGTFELKQTGDTFLDVSALGKGVIWINGHALGRFWKIGPQETLYVPGPWLRKGHNEVVVFDMLASGREAPVLEGRMQPILDAKTPDEPKPGKDPAAEFQ